MTVKKFWKGDEPLTDQEVMDLGWKPLKDGWVKLPEGNRSTPARQKPVPKKEQTVPLEEQEGGRDVKAREGKQQGSTRQVRNSARRGREGRKGRG